MNQSWSTGALRRKSLVGLLAAGLLLPATWAADGREGRSTEANPSSAILQSLTENERAWLKEHPVIRVAQAPDWPPAEFVDARGEPSGISEDYLRLIEQRLGIKFERVRGLSWQEAYARMQRWEIDMTTSVAVTPEREQFWAFTRPYMRIPIVFAADRQVSYIKDMHELEGRKVAVVGGYAVDEWIPRDFPDIELVRVESPLKGLEALRRGEVFAFADAMLIVGHYLTLPRMGMLKIAGTTPYVNAQSMAVRKDWAILAGILDKALDSISEAERLEIYRRWVPVYREPEPDYTRLWWALGIFAGILFVSGAWIWRLAREIERRKRAEAEADASVRRFRQLFEAAPLPLALSDREGALTLVNDRWEHTFGYTRKEIPTIKEWWRMACPDPDYRRWVIDRWEAAVRHARDTANDVVVSNDFRVTCKNGDVRTLEITGTFIEDDLLVAFYDITERKQTETKISESESLLSRSQEIAHIGSWSLDLTTNNLYWSDEVYRIFGCEPQEFTATYKAFFDFIHPDDRAAVDEAYSRSLREICDSYEIEHRILRQGTGEIRHVYERCVHVRDDNGAIIQSIGMVQDITVRKVAEAEQQGLLQQVERDRRALVSTLEDQRRTQESLRESEVRFRTMVESLPLAIHLTTGLEQVTEYMNPTMVKLFGYTREDIPSVAQWWPLAYPDVEYRRRISEDWNRKVEHAIATKTPIEPMEFVVTCKDGSLKSISWGFITMGDRNYAFGLDLTERKKLEIERQKFFLLAESSSEFIGMCDLDMNPLYVNPAGQRLVGLPDMAAACRVKVRDYYFPEDQRFIAEKFFPRVLREGHGDVEIRLRHFQTGEPIWMFYYLFCVHDDSGTPVGWATVSRDITERRQAELSLKSYAERLKNLHRIDQAILQATDSPERITQEAVLHVRDLLDCQRVSVGMFVFEKKEVRVFAASGEVDSVVQTGQVLPEEFFGELDILKQNRLEIIEDTSNMASVPAILRTIQAEGVRSSINAPIASPKGLIGVLSIGWHTPRTMTPDEQEIVSEVAGQIAIAIEQARLLQETKRHAEELEETVRLRTAQLEATNKELEAFSYSVSHDLRSPLRHISGYVDLLSTRFQEALPEKAGHYLNEVKDSAQQMGTLIDDLLQFSRTGRQELRQADMDMNTVVQETLEKLKPDTQNRNISWTVAELPRVYGDYSLLKQVWINLLENAVKYTRFKDQATIEVGFTREPDQWVFFVRDNGVGFDMQYANKLFGVFQRLHSPAQFEGTGIGLANVQRIVHKHGGRVRAEAQPEKGATFYFTLPRNTFAKGGTS